MQFLDEKVWLAVEVGWTKPTKLPASWDDEKIEATNFNSRALNAFFSAVSLQRGVYKVESAKEARTILQNTYEGTKAVKDSKFQRLTTSFEEIRMDDDEMFDEFYAKLKDIVNLAFNLGENISEPKIVRKILRSLPERSHAKITAIEE